MPCGTLQLKDWKAAEAEMRSRKEEVPVSLTELLKAVPYLAVVVVQDALELAEEFPQPLAHQLLLKEPTFR